MDESVLVNLLAVSPELIIAVTFLAGLLLGSGVCGFLWWRYWRRWQSEQQQIDELNRQQLDALRQEVQTLEKQAAVDAGRLEALDRLQVQLQERSDQLGRLERDNVMLRTRMEAEQAHYEEQLRLLKDAKEQLAKEFENLANKIFEKKQSQFTQSSQSTLENTLNPLREQIKDFRKQVEDAYHKENAERNKLVGQITELQKQTQRIGQDAVNLATALKGSSKTQGNWGEVILERLLEESGLTKGREYETQVSLKDETGKRRNPDVIVRLPENKDIVIDAKVSLVDYETYCNTEDDAERAAALKNHIASIKSHIDGLSKKNYENLEAIRTLDFVFIFIPIEAAFMLAMEHDQSLFRYAYDKQIVLVSPTTLLATLRTVENIWRYEKQNKNAEKIASMAGGLHDQFALVLDSLSELGQHIQRAQGSFEQTQKRLQTGKGNLYKRIQDLETLGAKTKRSLKKVRGAPGIDHDDDNESDDTALLDAPESSEET